MNKHPLPKQEAAPGRHPLVLVYDGQCPVCSAYSRMTRIREDLGGMLLVDARSADPIMNEITAAALDLDEGMVLKVGDRLYHGADAVHMLSLLSTKQGWLNRVNRALFGSASVAGVTYPVARFLRGLLLKLLGRTKIDNLGKPDTGVTRDGSG